jgi:hypothetical protein
MTSWRVGAAFMSSMAIAASRRPTLGSPTQGLPHPALQQGPQQQQGPQEGPQQQQGPQEGPQQQQGQQQGPQQQQGQEQGPQEGLQQQQGQQQQKLPMSPSLMQTSRAPASTSLALAPQRHRSACLLLMMVSSTTALQLATKICWSSAWPSTQA